MSSAESARRLRVAIALTLVYVIWGCSYVATKAMVTSMPPLLTSGLRFLIAGALLATFAHWRGAALPHGTAQWRHVVVLGLLGVFLNNAPHVIAMQHVASNQAALLNATPSLWIAWLGTFGHRGHPLDRMTRMGLALGCIGVLFLLAPDGAAAFEGLGWQLLILVACVAWSVATIYQRNGDSTLSPMMLAGMQMLVGGALMSIVGIAQGDAAHMHWAASGLVGFLWLTLLSSCVAFTAYGYLIVSTTPAVVGSYGYVNPVIAALAGWVVLDETLTVPQCAGMLVVLIAVAMVGGYWPRRRVSAVA
jgi:drug/metabolite transporter (DMT)-like permease